MPGAAGGVGLELRIAFTADVRLHTIKRPVLLVLVQHVERFPAQPGGPELGPQIDCWCALRGIIEGARAEGRCNVTRRPNNRTVIPDTVNSPPVVGDMVIWTGVLPDQAFQASPDGRPRARVRVMLQCDLVADTNGLSVDGNHLAPWLPARPTGDSIPGGLFDSWFDVVRG